MLEFALMNPGPHRKIIGLSTTQPDLDFETGRRLEFALPSYQQRLLLPRSFAFLTDLIVVFAVYLVFVAITMSEMPEDVPYDRAMLGVYAGAYVVLVVVYFSLFMLIMSQTPGMHIHRLITVGPYGDPLTPNEAILRSFGYAISTFPAFVGHLWAFVDPDHLSWTDKASGTFVRRL